MKTTIATLGLAAALIASPAFAQRIAFKIPLQELDAYDNNPVDDDGNPDTKAWVLSLNPDVTGQQRRQLVVWKNGGYCWEKPFNIANTTGDTKVSLVYEGRQQMLKVEPSDVKTVIVDDQGRWIFYTPEYQAIELQRLRCGK